MKSSPKPSRNSWTKPLPVSPLTAGQKGGVPNPVCAEVDQKVPTDSNPIRLQYQNAVSK